MDTAVEQQWQKESNNVAQGDFDALFAQLDRHEAVAPIDIGLNRLMDNIEHLRQMVTRAR